MTFLAFGGLLNFLACTVLGILVVINNPRKILNRAFFYLNLAVAFFNFGYFKWQFCDNEKDALFWFKFLAIGIIIINNAYLYYVFAFIDILNKKRKELLVYSIINLVFIILNLSSLLYAKLEPRYDLGFWPVPTIFFHIYLIFWFYQCLYAFYWLVKGYTSSKGIKHEQIKYFTIAALIGFGGGATNWPMWYNIHFPPYANVLITLHAIIITYAIIKHQLLNIKIAFTRVGVFLVIYIILLGIPLWVGLRTDFGIYSFFTLFTLAAIVPFVYRFFQRKADNLLLADQKKYQNLLYWTANSVVKIHDLDKLLETIVRIIVEAVKIEYAVIFLEDKENFIYKLKASKGGHPFINSHPYYKEFIIPQNEKIIKLIKKNDKPFHSEDIDNLLEYDKNKPIQLIISMYFDNKLIGFLFLGEKLNKSFYTREDHKAFEVLGSQTALAIENCLYMDDNKKIQERLFRTEKLSMFDGMAEGIAHQMRNRLNQFSIASSGIQLEIERFFKDYKKITAKYPEVKIFFDDLLELNDGILKNVKRTDALINHFIDFALTARDANSYSKFPLRNVIDLAYNAILIKHNDINNIALKIEIDEPGTVYGIMSQIQEMMYNLLDNSFEAIEEKIKYRLNEEEEKTFEPAIRINLKEEDDSYVIAASDNGVGIKEENKNKIFAPYFTTKSSFKSKPNPGIGMYIMYRIIEETHNGKISFESEYMKGTTFYIKLPKARHNTLSKKPGN